MSHPQQPRLFAEPAGPAPADVKALLLKIAEEVRPCRACGTTIYMVRHTITGALCPYDETAISHFRTCTHPEQFSHRGGH